eukprot:TRINITY_DN4661_c0_g1_i1.p2 TRINITY_DN4661_c0_g1~~TRINITY_DN4661_c0_g1_i1.p2  ORF type:complete len:535 (+),score=161.15 TRINITY_DN4661_c0_g1_i1:1775-3379(+)
MQKLIATLCLSGFLLVSAIRSPFSGVTCDACKAAFKVVKLAVDNNVGEEEFIRIAVEVCIVAKIQDPTVCRGIVPLMGPELLTTIFSKGVTAEQVCGLAKACPTHPSNWTVTFPKPKPPHVPPVRPNATSPRYQVLHLSDIHFDPLYTVGSLTKCPDPLCCRESDGPGGNGTSAGLWGDFNCDTSPAMLQFSLKYLASLPEQPQYLLWTGDNPPHDVWRGSRDEAIGRLRNVSQLLAAAFPGMRVLPALGNHDTFPVDSFPLPPANSWIYSAVLEDWAQWLTPDAQTTFAYGGYYQMLLHKGLRLVSLNTNYCDGSNFWLLFNSTDPAGMYTWFINVLQAAEDAGEKVWVIAHETPGDCGGALGENLNRIVDRYEDTIVGQFYGHHHNDQFLMFYSLENATRATSIAYVSPSITTFSNKNPQYRVYDVDVASSQVVESSTYNVDLLQANANNAPEFYLEYAASIDYQMEGLLPEDWAQLITRLQSNVTLFNQCYSYFNSEVPSGPCDAQCRKGFICSLNAATAPLYAACMAQSH